MNQPICGKNSYPSKQVAEEYARHRQAEERNLKLYTYECKICKQWHLTKQKQ